MKNGIKAISLSVMCALVVSNGAFAMQQAEPAGIPLRDIPSKIRKCGDTLAWEVKRGFDIGSTLTKKLLAKASWLLRVPLYCASIISATCAYDNACEVARWVNSYGIAQDETINNMFHNMSTAIGTLYVAHHFIPSLVKQFCTVRNQPKQAKRVQDEVIHYLPEIAK